MEIGKKFIDINQYNAEMAKPMKDKLYFVEKLPPPITESQCYIFVDFGCADGEMIRHLIGMYGLRARYVGYDCSETMINFANEKIDDELSKGISVKFTTKWEEVEKSLNVCRNKKVLILSSVVHEIYSYGSEAEIDWFWSIVGKFDYIVVRDMMCSKTAERKSNLKSVTKIRSCFTSNSSLLPDFEKRWGSIDENKNLIHFLLKYRYVRNWERELNENYLPITIEDFLSKVIEQGYRLDYFEKFRINFIEEKLLDDFIGLFLEDTTHIKAIFIKN